LKKKLERLDRLDGLEDKLMKHVHDTKVGFEKVDEHFVEFERRMTHRFVGLENQLGAVANAVTALGQRHFALEKRVTVLETRP